MTTALLTQVAVEALTKPPSSARLTQVAVEILWGAFVTHATGGALSGSTAAVVGLAEYTAVPVLSAATAINIGQTQATPQVVLTF